MDTPRQARLPVSTLPVSWPGPTGGDGYDGVVVRAVRSPDDPEWVAFLTRASERDLDDPDLVTLVACKPGFASGRRTTAYLLRRGSMPEAEAAAVVETHVDVRRNLQHVHVAAIVEGVAEDGPDLFGLTGDCIVDEIRRDLRWWENKVDPGRTLTVQVAPGPDGSHDGRLALTVAETVETYPVEPGIEQVLSFALAVGLRTAGDQPCHLPEPMRVTAPEEAREAWDRFLREADALLYENASQVRLRIEGGAVTIRNEDDDPIEDAGWLTTSMEAQETLSEILSDADLRRDAVLVVTWDYRAVFASTTWESDDWARSFRVALVETSGTDRTARRRDVRRFWTAFPNELASVMRLRRDTGNARLHPESSTAH